MLQLLSGLYLVFAAIVAFGAGGYLAGRLRSPVGGRTTRSNFVTEASAFCPWAIAIVLTVLMTWAAAPVDRQVGGAVGRSRGGPPIRRRREPHCLRPGPALSAPSGVRRMLIWLTHGRKRRASC